MSCRMQLVLALGMMVNSPMTARLPASLLWPLAPLMANRVLETVSFLLGFITPLVRNRSSKGWLLLLISTWNATACMEMYHEAVRTSCS